MFHLQMLRYDRFLDAHGALPFPFAGLHEVRSPRAVAIRKKSRLVTFPVYGIWYKCTSSSHAYVCLLKILSNE